MFMLRVERVEIQMKRVCAFVISLAVVVALLVAKPGLAAADTYTRPAGNQQAVNYVIERALSQRGVPYTYGGGNATGPTRGSDSRASTAGSDPGAPIPGFDPGAATPAIDPGSNIVGFDASGLVVYAFAGVGIKLPRSSGEQYKVGRKIPPALALPGDLIFYGPDGSQSVALFVGNGQMVEATDPVVTVSPVRTAGMTPYLARIIE